MPEVSGLMRGKRGLIMGVANNRSIAWGIAQACRDHGADLAFTYQGDALKKRVEPLAEEVDGLVVGHCDVTDAGLDGCGVRGGEVGLGLARFRAARHRLLRQGPARRAATSTRREDNFTKTMLVSCYSFTALAQRAEKLMTERRLAADADLLRRREVDAALQRDGRRQGRARSVGAISRRRSRRQEHPRQRDLGRPDQDAGRLRHRRLPLYPEVERVQRAAAAQRDDRGSRRCRRLSSCPTCRAA